MSAKLASEIVVGDTFVWCDAPVTVTAIEKTVNGYHFTIDRFGQSHVVHYFADESLNSLRTS